MKRRFLVSCGLHSKPKALEWLQLAAERTRPDGILFAGGVLTPFSASCGCYSLSHDDIRFVERFFETLGKMKVFAAVIPGPADTPLEEFLRLGMQVEMEYPTVHLVHASLLQEGDLAISGLGGCVWEGPAAELGACSRTLAEYYLRSLASADQPRRILLLSIAPTGALGGPAGSPLAGELIDSLHPSLCVVAGPSEHRGVQQVAQTRIVNPGCLADGWAALLDWRRNLDDAVEFLDLRELSASGTVHEIGVCD